MKSGLELLEELLIKMDILTKKVDVLEQTVKKIANSAKVSELLEKANNSNLDGWKKTDDKTVRFKIDRKDGKPQENLVEARPDVPIIKVPYKKVEGPMVKGKMILNGAEKSVALSDLRVRIFDAANQLIKETKTNSMGEWMTRLTGGQKYAVEITGKYDGKDLVPVNKIIKVPVGLEEYIVN